MSSVMCLCQVNITVNLTVCNELDTKPVESLTATSVNDNSVSTTFNPPVQTAPVHGYYIVIMPTNGFYVAQPPITTTSTSVHFNNLVAGTEYTVSVQSFTLDANGNKVFSEETTFPVKTSKCLSPGWLLLRAIMPFHFL